VAFSFVEPRLTRTTIYIDGFNLYYSRLKGTTYKWLDIVELFGQKILHVQDPGATLVKVKFFTAPVKASYARHGDNSSQAQTQYHRALQARHPVLIEIINGFHVFEPNMLPVHRPAVDPSKNNVTAVWVIEEKQTDVNLALHAYRDAVRGTCDQLVFCTNDSDMEPALQMIRNDVPDAKIGLVTPLRGKEYGNAQVPNKRLTRLAHWVRHHIRDDELEASQLPLHVPTRKKPASKPPHW
jgi:uncharacterized LabA/DUF88 family protein